MGLAHPAGLPAEGGGDGTIASDRDLVAKELAESQNRLAYLPYSPEKVEYLFSLVVDRYELKAGSTIVTSNTDVTELPQAEVSRLVDVMDIAVTLSTVLGTTLPSASSGSPLAEVSSGVRSVPVAMGRRRKL